MKIKLTVIVALVVTALMAPQVASAGPTATRAQLKCHGVQKIPFCAGKKGVGSATTRGLERKTSYAPNSTVFVFDSKAKRSVQVAVTIALTCKSNLASSGQTYRVNRTFQARSHVKKGRNVVTVRGKNMKCPSGSVIDQKRPALHTFTIAAPMLTTIELPGMALASGTQTLNSTTNK